MSYEFIKLLLCHIATSPYHAALNAQTKQKKIHDHQSKNCEFNNSDNVLCIKLISSLQKGINCYLDMLLVKLDLCLDQLLYLMVV